MAHQKVPGYARDTKRKSVEELYHLGEDRGETINLAAEHPEKVKELKSLLKSVQSPKKQNQIRED